MKNVWCVLDKDTDALHSIWATKEAADKVIRHSSFLYVEDYPVLTTWEGE